MNATATRPSNQSSSSSSPHNRPKRPLSAFNLFYRFKRQKILAALAADATMDKDDMRNLVAAPPGLEEHRHPNNNEGDASLNALRRKNIHETLEQKGTVARDNKARAHRKDKGAINGALSFVEMGKLMNASWKSCDEFAKSVLEEISLEGRDRYRQLVEDYETENKRRELAKKAVKKAQKKKQSSAKKNNNKKTLPTKKNKPSLKLKVDTSDEDEAADYSLAETMLQLTKQAPSNGYKMYSSGSSPLTKTASNSSSLSGPSLLDLLSKNNGGGRSSQSQVNKTTAVPSQPGLDPMFEHNATRADSIFRYNDQVKATAMSMAASRNNTLHAAPPKPTQADSIYSPPQAVSSPPRPAQNSLAAAALNNVSEDQLAFRIRQLEGQLAEERLRSHIRRLEDEMSKRKVSEGLLRSVLDNVITHNRTTPATAMASSAIPPALPYNNHNPFMQDGLWSLMSARMIHPSVQAHERASMLSRIAEPRRRSVVPPMPIAVNITKRPLSVPRGGIPESSEHYFPIKEQRHT